MNYQDEQTELLEFFLENSYYKAWRNPGTKEPYLINYKHLELMVNHKCNLKCKYCYMDKYHKSYFPKGSQNVDTLLRNTDLLIDWLDEKGFSPKIEIFAGDSLNDPTCRKVIHKLLDACLQGRRVTSELILPTNMGWLLHDNKIKDVDAIREKAEFAGVYCHVSMSVDGKYMEMNRPFKSKNLDYSDEMYDKMFKFLLKHPSSGIHPMIYSNNIEEAKKNFLWWQDMFEKYGLFWKHMYLLEVRNQEWTIEQTKEYFEFVKFLCHWSFDKCGRNIDEFRNFVYRDHGFNILSVPFGRTMRGMPCSIQSCVTVRLGDLNIIPCHRTAYKHMETAEFITENDKITGLRAKNIELWFAIQSIHNTVYPYCEKCTINSICSGGCLGAQYEATGSIFTPIPTVCRLFHAKIAALVEAYEELGIMADMCWTLNSPELEEFTRIRNYIMEDK